MWLDFVADLIIRSFGTNPAAFTRSDDKWPAAAAFLITFWLPFVLAGLFFLPFVVIWFWKKKFTLVRVLICFVVGMALLYGGNWLNDLSLAYGQSHVFFQLYGKSIDQE